jgi:hypothetical protein
MTTSSDLQRHIGKFYGKYSGEVINNEDDTHSGHITARVPSIFGTTPGQSDFRARPCLPYGHFFVPHVGAKVWVEFEAGDLGYPIWVGTWYPEDTVVEQAQTSPPQNRVIHTPAGHRIEIKDTADEETILIRHASNAFVSIDKDGNVLISNPNGSHIHLNAADHSTSIVDENSNIFLLNSDGALLVNGEGTALEVKGSGLRVLAGGTVQLSAKDIILDSGSVTLGNDAQTYALVGTIFAKMFDSHVHSTAMGPSGPPVPIISGTPAISQAVKVK